MIQSINQSTNQSTHQSTNNQSTIIIQYITKFQPHKGVDWLQQNLQFVVDIHWEQLQPPSHLRPYLPWGRIWAI